MSGIPRSDAGIPPDPACASCGLALCEPFGWCSNCRLAYCKRCGASHYCRPACRAAGCLPGLCVRTVESGFLSEAWKRPAASPSPETTAVDPAP